MKTTRTGVTDVRFGIEDAHDIAICEDCGTGETVPLPTMERLGELYAAHYNFTGVRGGFYTTLRKLFFDSPIATLWRKIDSDISFHDCTGEGRLLEIGCNEGRNLTFYKRGGYETYGLELNPVAAETARADGHYVFEGLIEDYEPDQAFDVVVLSQVLEHVHDPADMLKHVARLLKSGGEVRISCPNVKSWQASWFGRSWINWHIPFHIVHFNGTSLCDLLQAQGFGIVEAKQESPALWVSQSLIASLTAKPGQPTRQIRNPVLVMLLTAIWRGLLFPLLWWSNRTGHGDCLLVRARKVA